MQISKLFSQSAVSNFKNVQNENVTKKEENNLFKTIDTVSIKKDENVMVKYKGKFEELTSLSLKMSRNAEMLSSLQAGELTTLAYDAVAKSYSIIGNLKAVIGSYSLQMTSILSNPFLSEEERQSKIAKIEKKIKKLFEEGKYKMFKLYLLTETIKSLASVFLNLKSSNGTGKEITNMLSMMIENVNTRPTDLTNIDSESKMTNEINENKKFFFGENQGKLINGNLKDISEKQKEIEEKLMKPDLKDEEKEKLKQELILYNAMEKLMKDYK